MKKLIGFGFADKVGKTTATEHLAQRHNMDVLYLGDHIRKITKEMLPHIFDPFEEAFKSSMLTIDYNGRQLLRDVAALGNKYFGDAWLMRAAGVRHRLENCKPGGLVLGDIRSAGQAMEITKLGGLMVGIRSRRAENVVDGGLYELCDVIIDNDLTYAQFMVAVENCWYLATDLTSVTD